jgi:hypothetical protein
MDIAETQFLFRRVRSDLLAQQAAVRDDEMADEVSNFKSSLYPFSSIGTHGYEGVFIAGEKPVVLLAKSFETQLDQLQGAESSEYLHEPGTSSHHSEIFIHPIDVDGSLHAFAEFNNVNCPSGFLALNSRGALRFCALMSHFVYDAPLPFANVPFGDFDPDHITYHHASETYVVAGAYKVPFYLKKAEYNSGVAAGVIDINDEETKPVFEDRGKISVAIIRETNNCRERIILARY